MAELSPFNISLDVKRRLSKARYQHSLLAAQTAEQMAKSYGVDTKNAVLAGLLHDWDKDLSVDELVLKARMYGIEVPLQPESLLHALTAAISLPEVYPSLPGEVVIAIGRHTTAAPQMSRLDMIIYVSDIIEPSRKYHDPGFVEQVEELRIMSGPRSLEIVFTRSLCLTLAHLLDKQSYIHPVSIEAMADVLDSFGSSMDLADRGIYQQSRHVLGLARGLL
ncbi:MAG: bis(5'-nucleosyl)-tetraphosphatase (symmetrical) YqeK [Coriobacteriia bacterium]|nr:bis(5'-nucleosyl)-tetraphosphatase (symmetrical) YqeK [Coriobacteriia bacterium]